MAIFNSYVKLPEGNSHGFIRRKIRKGNQPRIHGLELQRHTKAVRNDGFWRSGDLWFESKWYPCPCVEISCFPSMYSIYIYIHIFIYIWYIYIYICIYYIQYINFTSLYLGCWKQPWFIFMVWCWKNWSLSQAANHHWAATSRANHWWDI